MQEGRAHCHSYTSVCGKIYIQERTLKIHVKRYYFISKPREIYYMNACALSTYQRSQIHWKTMQITAVSLNKSRLSVMESHSGEMVCSEGR